MTTSDDLQDLNAVKEILNAVPEIVFWINSEGRIVLANQTFIDLFGYTEQELTDTFIDQIDTENSRQLWVDLLKEKKTNAKKCIATKIAMHDKRSLPAEILTQLIDYKGTKYVSASLRLAPEKEKYATALEEIENKFRKTFENNPCAVYLSTIPGGRLLEVNKAFEEISGYSKDELIGKTVEELNFYEKPADRTRLLSELQEKGKLTGYEIFYRTKSGKLKYCSVDAEYTTINGALHLVGNITDISLLKETLDKLEFSEKHNRLLIKNMPVGLFVADRTGRVHYLSDNVGRITKYSSEEIFDMPEGILSNMHPEDKVHALEAINLLYDEGRRLDVEARIKNPDGSLAWLYFQANKIEEYKGIQCFWGTSTNIDERKAAEELIKNERDRARMYLDTAGSIMLVLDKEAKIKLINKKGSEILGYSEEELVGKDWFETCIPEKERKIVREGFKSTISGNSEKMAYFQNIITGKDGNEFLVAWYNTLIRDSDGKISGTLSSGQDITEKHKAEEQLRESETRFRTMIHTSPDGITTADMEGSINYASEKFIKLHGYEHPEEILGRKSIDLIASIDRERAEKLYPEVLEYGSSMNNNFLLLRKDGSTFNGELSVTLMLDKNNEAMGFIGITRDVSERKLAELALQESEASLKALINSTTDYVMLLDLKGNLITLNNSYAERRGQSIDSLIGINVFEAMDSEIGAERIRQLKIVENTLEAVRFEDYIEDQWYDNSFYPVLNSEGKISRFAIFVKNITDKKIAESRIRKSEEKFSSAFFTSPQVMAITTLKDGTILEINNSALTVFGYTREEMLGKTIHELALYSFSEDRNRFLNALNSGQVIQRMELKGNRRGVEIDVEISATEIELDGQKCALSIIDDITLKKQADQELKSYQEKLRSMATELASVEQKERRAIAENIHDYLGQSLALARIGVGKVKKNDPPADTLRILNDVDNQLGEAISYSQSVIYELIPPILFELGLLEALRWKFDEFGTKNSILYELHLPDRIPRIIDDILIFIYRSVTELLNNIIKHARASKIELSILKKNNQLIVELADNGVGFKNEALKIDYAAKQKFGLFSIRERVSYYGGKIEFSNIPESGAIVTIYVPLE